MRAHHDMGGQPAGPIEPSEHAYHLWEKQTHALVVLLSDPTRGLLTVDELRRGIEELGAAEYDRLTYYERWIASVAQNLLSKGVVSVDELGRKLEEVAAREAKPS